MPPVEIEVEKRKKLDFCSVPAVKQRGAVEGAVVFVGQSQRGECLVQPEALGAC